MMGDARYVALLRAVNVGGHQPVAMSALKAMLEELGFSKVRTLLQSGNVVFGSVGASETELEHLLEHEAKQRLGLDTAFFVRSAPQWNDLVADNPLSQPALAAPNQVLMMCLKQAPDLPTRLALEAAPRGSEKVRVHGRQVYVWYPQGIGQSRLKLPVLATGRNWNTVLKLAALLRD